MQAIVTTTLARINGYHTQTCNARELHAFLEVGRDFSNWIRSRVEKYGFIEGEDYLVAKSGEQVYGAKPAQNLDSPDLANQVWGGDRRSIEYTLTLDMAKELAMVERNEKGRQARRYFIECERQLRECADLLSLNMPQPHVGLSPSQRGYVSQLIDLAVKPMSDKLRAKRELRARIYSLFGVKINAIPPRYFHAVTEAIHEAGVQVLIYETSRKNAEKQFWAGLRLPALPAPQQDHPALL